MVAWDWDGLDFEIVVGIHAGEGDVGLVSGVVLGGTGHIGVG